MRHSFFPAVVFVLVLSTVSAQSIKSSGTVVDVLDAITLDIRIGDEVLRVQLANLSAPSISTPEGLEARNFTSAVLLNRSIWLDLDENSRQSDGIVQGIIYLLGPDGRPIQPSFNEISKDSGDARTNDSWFNDSDIIDQFVRDTWVPESTKESPELSELEVSSYDLRKEPPEEIIAEPKPGIFVEPVDPGCRSVCPPDAEVCVMVCG